MTPATRAESWHMIGSLDIGLPGSVCWCPCLSPSFDLTKNGRCETGALANAIRFLLPLVLAFALPMSAQWGKRGSVTIRPDALSKEQLNVGAAREVQRALSFIPNSEKLDWTINISSHDKIQKSASAPHKVFPARCFTQVQKKETFCDIEWVMDSSGMALAGSLAHEYGHILCYSLVSKLPGSDSCTEEDADRMGASLMHGIPPDSIGLGRH
jgi:hypothetical protein